MTRYAWRKTHTPAGFTNVFDIIHPQYHREIITRVPTYNVIPDLQSVTGSNLRLWFPSGSYGFDATSAPWLLDSISNVEICGENWNGLSNGRVVFKSLADTLNGRTRTGMVEISQCTFLQMSGITFDRNNTIGDAMYVGDSDHCSLNFLQFTNIGAISARSATANSTTDVITSGSNIATFRGSSPVNGDRIEFWVGSAPGDALPGNLAKDTGYLVTNVSGSTFKVTDLAGTPIDLSSNGSGWWGWVKGVQTIESINTGTDTITSTKHGFQDGQRVWAYNHDTVLTDFALANINAWWQRGYDRYINAKATDTYKIAGAPNGLGSVDITGTLGTGKPKAAAVCRALGGGGNLYLHVNEPHFTNVQQGIYLNYYGSTIQSRPYGANASKITNMRSFCGGHAIGGNNCTIEGGTHEGKMMAPNFGHFMLYDGVTTTPTLKSIYIESNRGMGPTREIVCNSLATVEKVECRGPLVTEVGSCFAYSPGTSAVSWGRANRANGHEAGVIDQYQHSVHASNYGGIRPVIFDGIDQLTTSETSVVDGMFVNAVRTGTDLVIGRFFRRLIGWEFQGSIIQELRQSVANPTELDLALGNVRQIEGSGGGSTIGAIKTAGVSGTTGSKGWMGGLLFNSGVTVLDATVVDTLSGANKIPLNGEAMMAAVNVGGKLRLFEPLGSVVARTPAALQGNKTGSVAAANLFSGAPNAGIYSIEVTVDIATAATSGTLDVSLLWNNGIGPGHNVALISGLDVSGIGPGFGSGRFTFKVASGNPQVSTTFTGTAGSLSYTIDVAVRRVG